MRAAPPVGLDAPQPAYVVYGVLRQTHTNAPSVRDCRSCKYRSGRMCDSLDRCNGGDRFEPMAPLLLWAR